MNKNAAIYPGTFDPITFGHMDLVNRALKLFDQIIVAISENRAKAPLFSLKDRISLTKQVFREQSKIEIVGFDCLLVDLAKKMGINTILRGLRVISDFDYEFRMANANRTLLPQVETVFLIPSERYTYVSSSLVREITAFGGDVSKFVPEVIDRAIKKKSK